MESREGHTDREAEMQDYEAIAAGLKLIQKANRAIESRRYGYDAKPGSDWHVKGDFTGYEGTPTYVGSHGKAALYATEDGTAYEVNVFSYAGKLAHKVTRKTLDAAFRIGQKLANEELPKDEPKPAPVVEEAPVVESVPVRRHIPIAPKPGDDVHAVSHLSASCGLVKGLPLSMLTDTTKVVEEPRTADEPANVGGPAVETVGNLVASWQAVRAELHEIERSEHPDITDRFGRVWTWKSKDLYRHCGTACDVDMIPQFCLPSQRALDNPNYDLCEICIDGRERNAFCCKFEWNCSHKWYQEAPAEL